MIDIGDIYEQMNSPHPSKHRIKHWLYVASPDVVSFNSTEKTGKWCIFKSAKDIDGAWLQIKLLALHNQISVAKTSTSISSGTEKFPDYIICVYNDDWEDRAEIDRIRECLRGAGFTEPLKYKRDIETINRVYGDDEFYIVE